MHSGLLPSVNANCTDSILLNFSTQYLHPNCVCIAPNSLLAIYLGVIYDGNLHSTQICARIVQLSG